MSLKICAVTGSRADWGLLSSVLARLRDDPGFTLQIIVTGQHLTPQAGRTSSVIEEEGFSIDFSADMGIDDRDDPASLTRAMGRGMIALADGLERLNPDLMLIAGDRYEILGAAQAALMARVPIAHLYGGDVTEGAIDELIRHALTKLSHLHFVTNEPAARRVIQMGEDPAQVYCVGSPALDHIHDLKTLDRTVFFQRIGMIPRRFNGLVTFHPVTQETDSLSQCQEMLAALESMGPETGWILTGSNADPQGQQISALLKDFARGYENALFVNSLGTSLYLNALRHVDVVVGNSSSGLYEAPSFGTPTVNIGTRQKGRLKAPSVVDCLPEREAIGTAIHTAIPLKGQFFENPYGDGYSASRIVNYIKGLKDPRSLCKKVFHNL